jgi:hypothetical protein
VRNQKGKEGMSPGSDFDSDFVHGATSEISNMGGTPNLSDGLLMLQMLILYVYCGFLFELEVKLYRIALGFIQFCRPKAEMAALQADRSLPVCLCLFKDVF